MSDELTQLDELLESDVLEALGEPAPHFKLDDADGEITDIPNELASIIAENESLEVDKDENIDDVEMLPMAQTQSYTDDQEEKKSTVSMDTANVNELVSVLSQLLNNKTIEITIKIKD